MVSGGTSTSAVRQCRHVLIDRIQDSRFRQPRLGMFTHAVQGVQVLPQHSEVDRVAPHVERECSRADHAGDDRPPAQADANRPSGSVIRWALLGFADSASVTP